MDGFQPACMGRHRKQLGPRCPVLPEHKLTSQALGGPGNKGRADLIGRAPHGTESWAPPALPPPLDIPLGLTHSALPTDVHPPGGAPQPVLGEAHCPKTDSGEPLWEGCRTTKTSHVSRLDHSLGSGLSLAPPHTGRPSLRQVMALRSLSDFCCPVPTLTLLPPTGKNLVE